MHVRPIRLLAAIAVVFCFQAVGNFASAQQQGYATQAFYQQPTAGGRNAPGMPASPLAGGNAAATVGGQFMDAYGNPIIMPANYCQSCPGYGPDCGPGCGPGYGGASDPMAVDFGGYAQDQCGPHYFDLSVDAVFLRVSEVFQEVGPFASAGAGPAAPRILDPNASDDEYEPGFRIAMRYDIGPLSLLEATYMGLYDNAFRQNVRSLDVTNPAQDFSLFTSFSNFGTGQLIGGVSDGQSYSLDYQADLQSTEISYRRYWVGFNPRVSGTYMMGARYLRLTEELRFDSVALDLVTLDTATRIWDSENDLVGFQFGGDMWVCLRQGMRIGSEVKTGIYNNRFTFRHIGDFPAVVDDPAKTAIPDFDVTTKGNDVAFAAEASVQMVIDILPSWSVRGGYQAIYMNSLTTAANNVDQAAIDSLRVLTTGDALYHGYTGGIEFVW